MPPEAPRAPGHLDPAHACPLALLPVVLVLARFLVLALVLVLVRVRCPALVRVLVGCPALA